jgi:hypothetical protein
VVGNERLRDCCRPNDPAGKLQAASRANGDAARQLPRLTIALAEANYN